ncbi:hypothetical protein BG005_004882 [Podila minutissima]|nr:hypothetical protein BG005_004882 [Podila minutissima]
MSTTQSGMSARQLAFSIPHICDDIASHLSAKDIRQCTLVSQEFHQLFFPYTWRSLTISRRFLYNSLRDKIRSSDGQVLSKNQHRIQKLSSIFGETWDLFLEKIDPPLESTVAATTLDPASNAETSIPQYTLCVPFANLSVLHALSTDKFVGVNYKNRNHIHQLLAIIQQSPRLRELQMVQFCTDNSMQIARLAHIVRDHRSLRNLKIKMTSVDCSLYRKLLWASWNLEQLEITSRVDVVHHPYLPPVVCNSEEDEQEFDTWIALNRPNVYDMAKEAANDMSQGKVVFRLKEFYLYFNQFDHEIGATFPFLRRCRALERLRLPRIYSRRAIVELAEQIPDNWPSLEHLDMGNLDPGRQVGDELEARILAACASSKSRHGGLTSLVVAPSHFTIPQSIRMICDHHSATLVHLDLVGCYKVKGHVLQNLLSSCSRLKSFVALCEDRIRPAPVMWTVSPVHDDPTLEGRDVEYAANWVCLGLESLRLKVRNGDMSTGEDRSNRAGLPRMIMWQIKQLKQLQDLRLCLGDYSWENSGFREDEDREIASWEDAIETCGTQNVGDALQAFENLEDLETLELRNMKDYVDLTRLKSSRKHWKKLKWVHYN